MNVQKARGISAPVEEGPLRRILEKYRGVDGSTIPILQEVQALYGYLPEEAVNWMADRLEVPRSGFFGVATFYSQFFFKPRGKEVVTVCCGTACHVKGSEKLLSRARQEFGLPEGEDTTADMKFTVERVACLGTCSMAPAVIVGKTMHGKTAPDKFAKMLKDLRKKEE